MNKKIIKIEQMKVKFQIIETIGIKSLNDINEIYLLTSFLSMQMKGGLLEKVGGRIGQIVILLKSILYKPILIKIQDLTFKKNIMGGIIVFNPRYNNSLFFIDALAIEKSSRGIGIGSYMMKSLQCNLRKNKRRVELELKTIYSKKNRAINFYLRQGFMVKGLSISKKYLVMRKNLE